MVSMPGVARGTTLVMPNPHSGRRQSSSWVMRSGISFDFEEQRPEAVRVAGEMMAERRRAHAGIDADKEDVDRRLDAVAKPPRTRRFRTDGDHSATVFIVARPVVTRGRSRALRSSNATAITNQNRGNSQTNRSSQVELSQFRAKSVERVACQGQRPDPAIFPRGTRPESPHQRPRHWSKCSAARWWWS